MKKTENLLYLIPVLFLAGCEGTHDGDPDFENPNPTDGYYIVADKTEIEANGEDVVTFKVYDPDGNDLTASTERNYVTIVDEVTGANIGDNVFEWTSIKDGEYEFSATFKGHPTENTVTVKSVNRSKYEKYFKKVVVYDITSTMCGPCHTLVEQMAAIPEEYADRMEVLAIHSTMMGNDPFVIGNGSPATSLMRRFGLSGLPATIYSLDHSIQGAGSVTTPTILSGVIENQLRSNPATCGIAVKSSAHTVADGKSSVKIDAAITSSVGGEYDLFYVLLLDNMTASSPYTYDDKTHEYDDIVLAMTGNYMSVDNTSLIETVANEEKTETYTFDLETELTQDYLDNMRVAVLALRSNGDASIVDNITVCKLGESADYLLN